MSAADSVDEDVLYVQELLESLLSAYKSESSDEAYSAIQLMISKLGDPYTRMIPAR